MTGARGGAWGRAGILIARVAVGGFLFWAAFSKVGAAPEEFAAILDAYEIVPPTATVPFARALPWIELALGSCLVVGFRLKAASAAAMFLHAVFFGALLSTLLRGIALADCGCFGSSGPHLSPPQTMVLDAVLFGLSFLVFRDRENRFSLDRFLSEMKRPAR